MKKITIIGAGIVGIATAAYLRRDGHEVTVIDRLLRLPLYFGITDAQVDAVIDAVKAFYSKSA